jgi:uncharacterized protein YejL (UPF0352 family)
MVTSVTNTAIYDIPTEAVAEQFTRILLDGIRKRPPVKTSVRKAKK